MKPAVYCENRNRGELMFFLRTEEGEYYLFSQRFRRPIMEYFSSGVTIEKVFDFKDCTREDTVIKVKEKLPKHLRYIESEYDITILRRSKKNQGNGSAA